MLKIVLSMNTAVILPHYHFDQIKERIPIYVLFAPSSFGVFKSALVLNQTRGPRFKVRPKDRKYNKTYYLYLSQAHIMRLAIVILMYGIKVNNESTEVIEL